MAEKSESLRTIKVFRYDPEVGGSGNFQSYVLDIPNETTTTILDVLLRLQREQDPTLAFRYACRVNMCGSCGMVINGKEGLACKTNVSHLTSGQEISLRPLNHFPVIKDLVVDMEPFFRKYEETLPYYEPREEFVEPVEIRPDSKERQDIGQATECIACGCCVSACTMVHYHEAYAGPAALNRAFTLLADSRDGLFAERLDRALASCYNCRTEFNCTEVCPKNISGTRAIKYIQRLALKHYKSQSKPEAPSEDQNLPLRAVTDRRTFLRQAGVGILGAASILVVGGVAATTAIGPNVAKSSRLWVPVGSLNQVPEGDIATLMMRYELKNGLYTQEMVTPILVSRTGQDITCFKASCTHLGCIVKWDSQLERFRCACHGGVFDREGNVLAGPPPRPLDRYRFKVDADHLFVEVV